MTNEVQEWVDTSASALDLTLLNKQENYFGYVQGCFRYLTNAYRHF